MQKSITSKAYAVFLDCLRKTREQAGITQLELAERLDETQSFVSKCERGERRLDVAELKEFCEAMDTTLDKFIKLYLREVG